MKSKERIEKKKLNHQLSAIDILNTKLIFNLFDIFLIESHISILNENILIKEK